MKVVKIRRLSTLALGAVITAACASASATTPGDIAARYAADARAMCDLVPKVYAFYATRSLHWAEACRQAQVEAAAVTTPGQGTAVLEHLVDALWDAHASLGVNTDASPWLVPSGSDLWLEAQGSDALVTGVRRGGAADRAGIRVGDLILSINGLAPRDAAKARIRTGVDDIPPERMEWALNAAGAGHRGQTRQLDLLRGGERIALELGDPPPVALDTPLNARMIGDIGYIRFNDSLGDPGTVTAFDAAVDGMRSAKGWIIDLRDTPSGGSTDVAEPVMGRFIAETADYQITQPLQATAYPRSIVARGPWTLSGPVAVLVGRWTGSMGEGMAIGFDGMKRGTVVGGPMAGLAGGVEVFKLPSTDTDLRLPTYGLAHMDGTPRHRWTPEVLVQPDLGGAQDPALSRAIRIVGGE